MARLGKYELLRPLSTGGMAELYLARQVGPSGFEKTVAIKQLLPNLANDENIVRLFLNEARIAARLAHPNIAQIYDLGSVGQRYFLAMEYVAGHNLTEIQAQGAASDQPLPHDLVAYVISRTCAGLHHAHTLADGEGRPLAVVHRDVSPENILVSFDGEVKLIDFGIAKATALAAETQAGLLKGKYAYMSPEQCRNEPLDARSDIFAVGIVLYELACRRRLFRRQSEFATMRAILEDPIPPPSAVADDVPDALEEIVMRALARHPAERYPDAQAMQEDLERAMRESGRQPCPGDAAEYMGRLFPLRDRGSPVINIGPEEVTQPGTEMPGTETPPATGRPDVVVGSAAGGTGRGAEARGAVPPKSKGPLREVPTLQDPDGAAAPAQAAWAQAGPLGSEEALDEPEEVEGERTMITAPLFAGEAEQEGAPAIAYARTTLAPLAGPARGDVEPPPRPLAATPLMLPPEPEPELAPHAAPGPLLAPPRSDERPVADPQARLKQMALPELVVPARRRTWLYVLVPTVVALGIAGMLLAFKLPGWAGPSDAPANVPPGSYPVALTSEPAGAAVHVDGKPRFGRTPLTLHGLTPGEPHTVSVLLDGYAPSLTRLVLDGSPASRALAVKLSPAGAPATLAVAIAAGGEGAEVYLDGEKQGTAPLTLDRVLSGKPHTLVVKKVGFEEQVLQIEALVAGERRTVQVTLQPAKALPQGVEDRRGGKRTGPGKGVGTVKPPHTPNLTSPREGEIGEHLPGR